VAIGDRSTRPRVFTIPPGVSFADALAASLIERAGEEPLGLSDYRLLLPNRRSVRSLHEALLRAGGGRALLLPRMSPVGDVDEDAFAFLPEVAEALDLPPAISETRRVALLARLVMELKRRQHDPVSPAGALRLARELAGLIDAVHTERLDVSGLEALVPEALSAHWQITLDFLKIVTAQWPRVLAEEGALDPADRRNRLIAALAAQWRTSPPLSPVIAAGTTGSIPATAELLGVVSRLPAGAVVLPGYDRKMDEACAAELAPTHPQFMMARLLEQMRISPGEVEDWPLPPQLAQRAADRAPRMRFLAAAGGLEETPSAVAASGGEAAAALSGVRRIDCAGPREEAGVIALAMREALETPGRTAALITPDRRLARRVRGELARWEIDIDDSAGRPAAESVPGAFLRLLARAAAERFAPVALLALLKHPLAANGGPPAELRRLARAIDGHSSREHGPLLRGPKPAPGIESLLAAADAAGFPASQRRALAALMEPLRSFADAVGGGERPLGDCLALHLEAAERLAASDTEAGAERLWRGPAGEALAAEIAELHDSVTDLPPVEGPQYPALFDALIEPVRVRPPYGHHPRLAILGPIEARLHQPGLVILGGLNEGTWPPAAEHDPWMSRQMRSEFGLPAHERRVGQAAHDFVQASGADEVIFTRAAKVDGTPTLESRWLAQLDMLAPRLERGTRLRAIQESLDRPEGGTVHAMEAPRPAPPVNHRPTRLSVTQVELWMRDPYALYAKHILGLEPLPPLEADPAAAERGVAMHDALDAFMKRRTGKESEGEAFDLLEDCGREAFGPLLGRPAVWAFWWPRFRAVARRFLEIQAEREAAFETLGTEIRGRLELGGPHPFTLTAKADRIDRRTTEEGGLEIIDYKTGSPPKARQIEAGYAPQLPLEGWMAEKGVFDGLAPARVDRLAYWQLRGTREPIGMTSVNDPDRRIRAAEEGLARLVARFARAETPYLSNPRPYPGFMGYGEYDHLARVDEWRALPTLPLGDGPAEGEA